uniref:Uncharacterized protein n=1 Tax=Salix viminalis TaxID=40686 RepID=A0A6N2MA17_SALVM
MASLELAKLIAQKGHKITFICTPRNIDRLPKIPPYLAPLINFVKLPLPREKPISSKATKPPPMSHTTRSSTLKCSSCVFSSHNLLSRIALNLNILLSLRSRFHFQVQIIRDLEDL